jgi:predicted transporter
MKILVIAASVALNAGAALAHSSLVPHEHPHLTSMLPDALALLLAALLVGAGFVAFRRPRKD